MFAQTAAQTYSQTQALNPYGPPPPESGLRKLLKKLLRTVRVLTAAIFVFNISSGPVLAGAGISSTMTEQVTTNLKNYDHTYQSININPQDVRQLLSTSPANQKIAHGFVERAISANIMKLGEKADREDVRNDVLVRVLRFKEEILSLSDDEMVKYVHTLIARSLIDHRRKINSNKNKENDYTQYLKATGALVVNHCEGGEEERDMKRLVINLTHREYQVFALTAKGFKREEIAKILNIGPETVKTHKSKLMRKIKSVTKPMMV